MEEQRQKPSAPPTISLLARVRPKHTTHHARHEPTMPAPHKQAKHVGVFARNPFDATTAHLTNTIWALLRNMDLFSPPELSAPLSSRPSRWGHHERTGHISPKQGMRGHICQAVLGSYTLELKPPLGGCAESATTGGWSGCMNWTTHRSRVISIDSQVITDVGVRLPPGRDLAVTMPKKKAQ